MRSLWVAQRRFQCLEGCGGFATSFEQLSEARLIDFEIQNGIFGNYQFEMEVTYSENNPALTNFEIWAIPINYSKTNLRSFYISHRNFLRGADKGGKSANENDPMIEF